MIKMEDPRDTENNGGGNPSDFGDYVKKATKSKNTIWYVIAAVVLIGITVSYCHKQDAEPQPNPNPVNATAVTN